MRTYGQFCPTAKAAELFCERWTPLILRELISGSTRFSELQRGLPLASPTILSRRLKELEAEGVIARRRSHGGGSWTYHLTPAGEEFAPIVHALAAWGQRWTRRELADHEVDLRLLIWALQRSVNPGAFGRRRTVVKLTFRDQPQKKRHWWFVNDNESVDLCLEEPDSEIDLYLSVTLRDMIYLYRGDLKLTQALESGRLDAEGSSVAMRALPRWLTPPPIAEIPSMRADALAA
jgi:DNA-binding HxlR family transcriptional regulator